MATVRGPGLTRHRLWSLNAIAKLREEMRLDEFDPDAPAVKAAVAKRERRRERNLRLAGGLRGSFLTERQWAAIEEHLATAPPVHTHPERAI